MLRRHLSPGDDAGMELSSSLVCLLIQATAVVTLLTGVHIRNPLPRWVSARYRFGIFFPGQCVDGEVHCPSKVLPKAVAWSVPIGAIRGVMFRLPIVFTLPHVATLLSGMYVMEEYRACSMSWAKVLAVRSGQPIAMMLTLATGM
ncbi:hypothetical protein EDD15DRAFT_1880244 [Pisolithus albus]|nr:hypothetical protein EDD15DRAFT_1880244 [Pisolithus albus]